MKRLINSLRNRFARSARPASAEVKHPVKSVPQTPVKPHPKPTRKHTGKSVQSPVESGPTDVVHGHHKGHRQPKGKSSLRPAAEVAATLPADSAFRTFALQDEILAAIADLGFTTPTPVQMECLPHALAGKDIAGRAQTGTGKTAAFLIGVLHRFLADGGDRKSPNPMALVMAPTRELAIQIGEDAEALAKYTSLRKLVVYGGMDYQKQKDNLDSGIDLLIATPGRLLDYLRSRSNLLSEVSILIIDEADRMLDMGFIPDMRRIIGRTPPPAKRQTLLYSATLTPAILRLAESWTRDPVTVEIAVDQVVAEEVNQVLYSVVARNKLALLLWLLNHQCGERVLIFCNRRIECDKLAEKLLRYGVMCEVMSGDVPQKKRMRVLEDFKAAKLRVIVATDVAGRGIHVDNISHVINYDLPYEPDDYVHRIGRTGRAGAQGKAIGFACEEGSFVLPDIEEYIGERLECVQPEPDMLILPPKPDKPAAVFKSHTKPNRSGGRSSGGPRRSGGRGGPRRRS
ncbi:MAG: DEAD/DEAH box helicase [Lentisphaeria bacterium]|nr:DEAD/DEAH box helicase [Lentisphaeria bacterium]